MAWPDVTLVCRITHQPQLASNLARQRSKRVLMNPEF